MGPKCLDLINWSIIGCVGLIKLRSEVDWIMCKCENMWTLWNMKNRWTLRNDESCYDNLYFVMW